MRLGILLSLMAFFAAAGCASDTRGGGGGRDGGVSPDGSAARPDARPMSRLDASGIDARTPAPGDSCTQVDLLFVIDNSLSMGRYQEALASAFPGFVDAMYDSLPAGTNVHVGITTTSFFSGNCSESVSNCVTTASEAEVRAHYVVPGTGDTGTNGEQGRLFEHNGLSWFEVDTSDPNRAPLESWFASAATAAGETGCSFEVPTAAASYAFDPANAAVNSGFLRDDDTVLLLFFLTDEPDKSPDELSSYVARVTAAKAACGGAACVRTAGLINPCVQDVDNVLWRFMNAFGETPVWGSIQDVDRYLEVVGAALATVLEQACDEVILI